MNPITRNERPTLYSWSLCTCARSPGGVGDSRPARCPIIFCKAFKNGVQEDIPVRAVDAFYVSVPYCNLRLIDVVYAVFNIMEQAMPND